jgi:maltose alpha-D-glucosyltransferase/alpha-amylase
MQWSRSANAGFSSAPTGRLYLPVRSGSGSHFVSDQDADPGRCSTQSGSWLNCCRNHPALGNRSEYQVVYAQPGRYPFAFLRQGGGETIFVALNPADRSVQADLSGDALAASLEAPRLLWGVEGGLARTTAGWKIALPGVSCGVYRV